MTLVLPWRRKHHDAGAQQGAALEAWEAVCEARQALARAEPLGEVLKAEKERNHLEDLFRKALFGGKK